jgi:hypothetical protein
MSSPFERWSWENTWVVLLLCVAVCLSVLAVLAITAEHRPRQYYLLQRSGTVCVMASIEWDEDTASTCVDDANKAVDILKRLTEVLPK